MTLKSCHTLEFGEASIPGISNFVCVTVQHDFDRCVNEGEQLCIECELISP